MFIGSKVAGIVKDLYTSGEPLITNWTKVWLVPAGIATVVFILFMLFFKDNRKSLEQI
jgi:hypothetical protein